MNDKGLKFLVLSGIFAILSGCQGCNSGESGKKTGSKSAGIVATVGNLEISLEDFERHINQQNRLVRTRYKSLEQKKKLLQSLVEREAMVLEAKRLGLDKDPDVTRGWKKILARHLVNQEFNQKRAKQIKITDEEIARYYEDNHDRYHAPEKIRLHRIFFRGPKTDSQVRKEARAKAQQVLSQLRAKPQDRRLFIQLAREHSEDEATKRIGGDTNFKTNVQLVETYGKVFADAAFGLKQTNDVSNIIEDEKGFHILRQSGKQPPIDLPLDKVKEQIRTTLFARMRGETYKAYVEEIKQKAGVKIFADVVEKAKVDLSDVPAFPGRDKPGAKMKEKGPLYIRGPLKGKNQQPGSRPILPSKRGNKPEPPVKKPAN